MVLTSRNPDVLFTDAAVLRVALEALIAHKRTFLVQPNEHGAWRLWCDQFSVGVVTYAVDHYLTSVT